MGEVSGRLADLTVITSDNPRDEEPQAILDDIRTGIGKTEGAFVEIADRKEAIRYRKPAAGRSRGARGKRPRNVSDPEGETVRDG